MEFKFNKSDKIKFYSKYLFDKLVGIWYEVKFPKTKFFIYEFLYSFRKLVRLNYFKQLLPSDIDYVHTSFGKFHLRKGTEDVVCASPAFERPDVDYLISLIGHAVGQGKKILFVDIGADFGTYSVTVGNKFSFYDGLKIVAFEPSVSSFLLLNQNIKLNAIEKVVTTVNLALSDLDGQELILNFDGDNPGGSSVRADKPWSISEKVKIKTITFDSYFKKNLNFFDIVFLKLDVEGFESKVFEGAKSIFSGGIPIYILIEDCVDMSIVTYLKNNQAQFIQKITPYNSFWKIDTN